MTAFLNFCFNSYNAHANKTCFISQPPGPVILLWTNDQTFPNLTGVSVVSQHHQASPNNNQTNSLSLINTIANEFRGAGEPPLPFLDIRYDIANNSLVIDGTQYSVKVGGEYIANIFKLAVDNNEAKLENRAGAVSDPFHIWSRDFFSGTKVRKVDIDLVIVHALNNQLSSIVEIKRSAKSNFNTWQPYDNDKSNYEMMFALSDTLNVPFYTIHHNEVQERIMPATSLVNVYTYQPNRDMPWKNFRSLNNREQIKALDTIALL